MSPLHRLLLVAGMWGCGSEPAPELPTCDPPRGPLFARFTDVTQASGVRFAYRSDSFKGGALAVVDLDGDTLPEIVAGRRTGGVALFRNRGELRFEDRMADELGASTAASAIAAVDLDNDGDRDLVLAGARTLRVIANLGNASFVETAQLAGAGTTEHVLPVDVDGDGLLDLYLSNYDVTDASQSLNRLYTNRGNLQFAARPTPGAGLSWSATAFDVDDDGDQDLYIANDTLLADRGTPIAPDLPQPVWPVDLLLRNDGLDGEGAPRFTDIASELGLARPRSSMGGLVGDFDGDRVGDLFVPDFGANKLFVRDGDRFVDRAAALGLTATSRSNTTCQQDPTSTGCLVLSWSAALADLDLDGYDELVVVNGETTPLDVPPVIVFTRGAELPYREVSTEIPCMDARSLVVTDLDGDGDQDVVIAQREGPLLIYENRGRPEPGTWLTVTLRGTASNRDGVGAVISVQLASGRTLRRTIGAGGVVHAASPSEAHFGLGDDRVERIEARWPSGRITEIRGPTVGRIAIDEPPIP